MRDQNRQEHQNPCLSKGSCLGVAKQQPAAGRAKGPKAEAAAGRVAWRGKGREGGRERERQ